MNDLAIGITVVYSSIKKDVYRTINVVELDDKHLKTFCSREELQDSVDMMNQSYREVPIEHREDDTGLYIYDYIPSVNVINKIRRCVIVISSEKLLTMYRDSKERGFTRL